MVLDRLGVNRGGDEQGRAGVPRAVEPQRLLERLDDVAQIVGASVATGAFRVSGSMARS